MRVCYIALALIVVGGLAGNTSYAAQVHQVPAKSAPANVGGLSSFRQGAVGGPANSGPGSVGGPANKGTKIAGTDIRPKAKR
jgi:hypothetical protein